MLSDQIGSENNINVNIQGASIIYELVYVFLLISKSTFFVIRIII